MVQPGVHDRQYFPRIIGLGPTAESISSGMVYEILASGRDEVGSLSKMMGILNSQHLKVTTAGGFTVPEPGTFVWTGFLDYKFSESKPEETLREFKKLAFVTHVELTKIGEVLFERFLFPVSMMNKNRVIIVRAEPFMRLEQRLITAFGTGGAAIVFEEGRNYSLEAFGQYLLMLPGASPEVILRNAVAGLRATGWGLFEIDISKLTLEGVANVSIKDPPFSAIPGARESSFVNGLACGALEGIFSVRTGVQSSRYDEATTTLHLFLKTIR